MNTQPFRERRQYLIFFSILSILVVASLVDFIPVWGQQPAKNDIAKDGSKALSAVAIHQEITFTASPQQLYEALLDSKQFSEFSARAAQIKPSVGGAFTLFANHIVGVNVELIPNQRIVQAWRVVDWPQGIYSIARFELKPSGSGTILVFDHIGFPDGLHDHLADGWQKNYWELLTKYFQRP
jgi:activator of HSP90 ATPase